MFSHDSFDFHDSNEAFSEISASGMESLYSAESSTSKAEFPRRKRHMTSETIEKRKQQNRTAQKAFRERKERHLREIESQLSYKQHQIQAICGQNRYLEDKCLFLSNQYEILEKKFQDAQTAQEFRGVLNQTNPSWKIRSASRNLRDDQLGW
ncbi:hypothetical protein PSTT_14369 [Puccinia striiformis]|uniref:BZIP domain-containing protein n=1 Tax=Puccinia striiformis TaxID=27350 RepID=A0A2S4UMI2_9BASI|nr:hypothetical protein PSTT_14369 [Puccinia striiformis]